MRVTEAPRFRWGWVILGVIIGLVVLAALAVANWKFGWWYERAKTDERVRVQRHNIGSQQAFQDAAESYMLDYEVLEGPAKANAERRACDQIGNLTDSFMTDELDEFQEEHC